MCDADILSNGPLDTRFIEKSIKIKTFSSNEIPWKMHHTVTLLIDLLWHVWFVRSINIPFNNICTGIFQIWEKRDRLWHIYRWPFHIHISDTIQKRQMISTLVRLREQDIYRINKKTQKMCSKFDIWKPILTCQVTVFVSSQDKVVVTLYFLLAYACLEPVGLAVSLIFFVAFMCLEALGTPVGGPSVCIVSTWLCMFEKSKWETSKFEKNDYIVPYCK